MRAERLKVWMLPTLAIIKHEKTTDYVVGLDELGGSEDFSSGGCWRWCVLGVQGRAGDLPEQPAAGN